MEEPMTLQAKIFLIGFVLLLLSLVAVPIHGLIFSIA